VNTQLPTESKFLVTGGAGFIGSNFVRKIVSLGYKVNVLDKLTYAGNLENIRSFIESGQVIFFQGDICDPQITSQALDGVDVVVNFAAESHVDRSIENSLDFVRTNVLGTENLLARSLKAGVKTFIQISTDEVYGSIETGSWTENSQIAPNSPYSASKAAGDLLALAYFRTHGLDVRITRCSNNYGPYQLDEKLVPTLITRLIKNERLPIYGNGLNQREWIFVDDHCSAVFLVLQKGVPGNIYNIGSGLEMNNLEMAHKLVEIFGRSTDLIEFVPDRKGHDFRYSVDSQKVRKLGFTCSVGFDEGIQMTADWYLENKGFWGK
jgi:dTDP-glucose 4,6-dehydratase